MKSINQWIVSKLIKDYEDIQQPLIRGKYGAVAGWVSIIGNVILGVVKIIFGILLSSLALIADAVHTFSDVLSSIVVLIGFKVSTKPSDNDHPFGHGRMEAIATLVIAVLLFVVAIEFIVEAVKSIITIVEGGAVEAGNPSWLVIGIIGGTVIVKLWMSLFSKHLGEAIQSDTLKADYWHHFSDVLTTLVVIASLIGLKFNLIWIDPVGGIVVSLIIIWAGYSLGRDAVNVILGTSPNQETIEEIKQIAQSSDGVLGVHNIIIHNYGNTNMITLHIEVDHNKHSNEIHEIADEVEKQVSQQMNIKNVTVHSDPINIDNPLYLPIKKFIENTVKHFPSVRGSHDLRINQNNDENKASFGLLIDPSLEEEKYDEITKMFYKEMKREFPNIQFQIKLEVDYSP